MLVLPALLLSLQAFKKADLFGSSVPQKRILDAAHQTEWKLRSEAHPKGAGGLRILHLVFTSDVSPNEHPNRIQAAHKTWASNDDVWKHTRWVSDKQVEDESRIFPMDQALARQSGTPGDCRLRFWAIEEAYTRVKADYDWFVFSNDNTMFIEENLAAYLDSLDKTKPLFLGSKLVSPERIIFNSASAIVLSTPALVQLIGKCGKASGQGLNLPYDLQLAHCMKLLKISPLDTRDPSGGERFLMYNPVRSAKGGYDGWFSEYKKPLGGAKKGLDCCAAEPVSMHYLEAPEMLLLHRLLHNRSMHTQAQWAQEYDELRSKVGGYSWTPDCCDKKVMAQTENLQVWELLMKKIQISGKR